MCMLLCFAFWLNFVRLIHVVCASIVHEMSWLYSISLYKNPCRWIFRHFLDFGHAEHSCYEYFYTYSLVHVCENFLRVEVTRRFRVCISSTLNKTNHCFYFFFYFKLCPTKSISDFCCAISIPTFGYCQQLMLFVNPFAQFFIELSFSF